MAYVLPKLPGVKCAAEYCDVGSVFDDWDHLLLLPTGTTDDHLHYEDVPHIEAELDFDFDNEVEPKEFAIAWDEAKQWADEQHLCENTTVISVPHAGVMK